MSSSNSSALKLNPERPPSMNYSLHIGTPEQEQEIFKRLRSMHRQTMNFRTMSNRIFFVLLDEENGKKMVGWQGLGFNDGFPNAEKFSLHIDDEYRSFLLGLALETAFYQYLDQNSISFAIGRMDVRSSQSLLDYRLSTGITSEMKREDLPEEWLNMCQGCELFKKSCINQVFIRFDTKAGLEFGRKRLGVLKNLEFPHKIELIESQMRKSERQKFVAKWAS